MNRKRRLKGKKSRTKAKKPKFLSLRLQFPAKNHSKTGGSVVAEVATSSAAADGHGELNLFPLLAENQVPDCRESDQDQENVAYFFSAADGGATALTGILDDAATAPSISSSHTTNNNSYIQDELSPSSASLTCAYRRQECKDGAAIVRKAMRNRERDSSEEKWVCYSEVMVERKMVKEEEVSSSAAGSWDVVDGSSGMQRLSLKLDYEEILNAWSDKGRPLYVDSENSQIVPDMADDTVMESSYNYYYSYGGVGMGGGGGGGGMWSVPEMSVDKIGQREASVLRYKEKRRNRLFSNKIRYQVRKLNAQKRPRLKGRFVKRS